MKNSYAYVTFVMCNDSFIPGALALGYALKKFRTQADLVCLVTDDISLKARQGLALIFDRVIEIETIELHHDNRQERQDRPYLFTRFQALRLGTDGDLGTSYDKIMLMDADLLPLCHYDHLFELDAPAGIINEYKENCIAGIDRSRQDGKSIWHDTYEELCPHGKAIPKYITDRVWNDGENMGVNASLWLLSPSMDDYNTIIKSTKNVDTMEKIAVFKWPEMQFATYYWSGKWTNIDIRYSAFNAQPSFETIYGNHYAGLKPWNEKRKKSLKHYFQFIDYRHWYWEFERMVKNDYPKLLEIPKVRRVYQFYQEELK